MSANILEKVGYIVISAAESFVVEEKIVVNKDLSTGVLIGSLNFHFRSWFGGKTEDPITEQVLYCHKLLQSSADSLIINELGGEAKAETTLSQMFFLMEKQKQGEDGVLLLNSSLNIFYIKDWEGILRTVYVSWDGICWHVGATSVDNPLACPARSRVFSPCYTEPW